ncbi:DUF6134 family protein [Lutibacter holmesii]|uniref:DUF6134 family protein n=1 Tax=Lutibacter holmesii TaxID=1137985 RepID=A0ABW3WTA2_9FLAO
MIFQKIKFLIFLLLCGLSCFAQDQHKLAVYNIRAMGMNIGTITVQEKIEGENLFVEATSDVEVCLIFKIRAKYMQSSRYRNGVLQESLLKTYKRGKLNSTTRLAINDNGYIMDKDGKISQINDVINYSGSSLWFHEPKEGASMYFEISGEKAIVKLISPHKYSIKHPNNGNKNEYTFKKGILKNALIKHSLANVYLSLQEVTESVPN